ncbi:MAG: hypothetical protein KJN63_02895 [Acidimicrobiia bacterium]|nr:hypothetical protein [Acidimicrobiia bacterium]
METLETALIVVGSIVAVLILIWFIRYARSVFKGDYQHTDGAKQVWWVPGGGGHGGGGQVPPIVTNDED